MKNLFIFLLRTGLAITVFPLLYLLEPFVRLRFGHIHNQRLGHLALNVDVFIKNQQLNGVPPRTFYFFAVWDPASRQYLEMLKRHLPIYDSRFASRLYYLSQPLLRRSRFFYKFDLPKRWYNLANKGRPYLSFTDEEEARGQRLLESMGIPDQTPFVLFSSRDTRYINTWRPGLVELQKKTLYRDCAIGSFLLAAEYIASQGYIAVRVGSVVSEPLPDTGNDKIIDYASGFRSDFGDIYLFGNCHGFLCPASGISEPTAAFGIPRAMVNCAPFDRTHGPRDLFVPKLVRSTGSGEILPFSEIEKLGFFDKSGANYFVGELCQRVDCKLVDNEPEDIRDAAADLLDTLNGVRPSAEAAELQNCFMRKFHALEKDALEWADFDEGGQISPRFALKHKNLIVDTH